MNRRDFLKIAACTTFVSAVENPLFAKVIDDGNDDLYTIDSLVKMSNSKIEDVFLDQKYHQSFYSVIKKLNLVQRHVGFGNYNVLSFDEAIFAAKRSNKIKSFTTDELDFMEYIFYRNPNEHGFYGERTCSSITETINKKEIYKVPYSGHYLFKDKSLDTYNSMVKDIGDSIILTSGVRSVMKQMKLFLDKLNRTKLNISEASISLAPPAYSFHSTGDFDIGKRGFGYDNFTERFATTKEFEKMTKLTYVDIRYTINNKDGVRYEPWHVTLV